MVIWTLLLAVAAPGQVLAGDLEPLIRQLGAGDFAAKIETVEHIAATGDARVVPVLEAMLASRLAVRPATGQVMITETRGRVDQQDGEVAAGDQQPEAPLRALFPLDGDAGMGFRRAADHHRRAGRRRPAGRADRGRRGRGGPGDDAGRREGLSIARPRLPDRGRAARGPRKLARMAAAGYDFVRAGEVAADGASRLCVGIPRARRRNAGVRAACARRDTHARPYPRCVGGATRWPARLGGGAGSRRRFDADVDRPCLRGRAAALATLLYTGTAMEEALAFARDFASKGTEGDLRVAATCVAGLLVVRWLGRDALTLRAAFGRF